MITENIVYLKNIFDYGSVEDICRRYQYISIHCTGRQVDGMAVGDAMIDCVVETQIYSLYINDECVKQGGDEISWELMKPFFDNGGIMHEGKFYSFDHAELIENSS
jgi:hypothetical protein